MKHVGFWTSLIKWVVKVLSLKQTKKLVCIDNVFSGAGTLKYGVPQCSILELLLFLLHVNCVPQSLSEVDSSLYVDGTDIFYQNEDVKKLKMF